MARFTLALATSGLVAACHGGRDGTAGEDAAGVALLDTTTTSVNAQGDIVENTCGNNVEDLFDAFDGSDLKFDQVATGLSVFYDPDIGWIPCQGSIDAFLCAWGNAPPETPAGVWTWVLEGEIDGDEIVATLTLEVSCTAATNNCDACEVVQEITGRVSR